MLEHEWSWHLTTFLCQGAEVQNKIFIETPFAEFPVDYLIELDDRRIGILFDHLDELHLRARSAFRDALLIDAGGVDILYRFNSVDFSDNLQDCMALVAKWNPELFCERGLINLERLASKEALAFRPLFDASMLALSFQHAYSNTETEPILSLPPRRDIVFRRMCRFYPAAWQPDYHRALVYYGISQDQLNECRVSNVECRVSNVNDSATS